MRRALLMVVITMCVVSGLVIMPNVLARPGYSCNGGNGCAPLEGTCRYPPGVVFYMGTNCVIVTSGYGGTCGNFGGYIECDDPPDRYYFDCECRIF